MILYLFKYNNYYNRQLKGYSTIDKYPEPIIYFHNVDFKPGNRYNTQCIVNTESPEADYLIVCTPEGDIDSRWFIMSHHRNRAGQETLSLQRDVLFDFRNSYIDAPMFIEKGPINVNSAFALQRENFSTNQVKVNEYPLVDQFALPWVVAYIKKSVVDKQINVPASESVADYVFTSLDQYEYYANKDNIKIRASNFKISAAFYRRPDPSGKYYIYWFGSTSDGQATLPDQGEYTESGGLYKYSIGTIRHGYDGLSLDTPEEIKTATSGVLTNLRKVGYSGFNLVDYLLPNDQAYYGNAEEILNENGKIIYVSSENIYYKIGVIQNAKVTAKVSINNVSGLGKEIQKAFNVPGVNNQNYSSEGMYLSGTYQPITLTFTAVSQDSFTLNITGTRTHTSGAPYDILAIPSGTYKLRYTDQVNLVNERCSSEELVFKFAAALSEQLGDDLLDIQYLPYAPCSKSFIDGACSLNVGSVSSSDFKLIQSDNTLGGICFFIQNEDFTAELFRRDETRDGRPRPTPIQTWIPEDPLEFKVMNQCTEYRIVGPNYDSVFSITPTRNGGFKNLRADCTYKPFNPYIRVYPEFDRLYGDNYGDARGLICSGDFSLPRTSNDWINYQLNNKNYKNAFDRQIENLEFNNEQALREARISAMVGTIGAAGQTGLLFGGLNPAYGVAGGAAAGLASAAAGLADIDIMKKRQAETLDYTKDQFDNQLGSIKARPSTVAKVSAFDINSKVFPFVETYDATEDEKRALRDKLTWNGCTINAISTMRSQIESRTLPNSLDEDFTEIIYIKGKVIRIDLDEDFEIASYLAEELNKGVYYEYTS